MSKQDRLAAFAKKACLEIFELFDEISVQEQLPPIVTAWHVGRELSALLAEIKEASHG